MRIALLTLAALVVATPAWACGGEAKISGDFQTGESGWGDPDTQFEVSGAAATFKPQAGTQAARWNAGTELTNVDACVTIAMPENVADPARGYAGLLFWVVDKDNFHQAVIAPNGMITVARKAGGRILPAAPITWMQSDAVQLGANAKNTLQVSTEGQNVVVRINDKEVARFRGQPPEGASHVGLVASSSPADVYSWHMTDFSAGEPAVAAPVAGAETSAAETTGAVNAPPQQQADADCGSGRVLFEDKFADYDPMWGAKTAEVTMSGGEAEFDPAPGTPTLRWNRAFVFNDLDACASVRLAKETANPTASYAGLLFWVKDSRNYYQAVIAPNGYFTVARIVDGKVVAKRPVEWTKLGSVKTGAKERNSLRLTVKGAEVVVAVNGKQAASFRGDPPHWPSYIGMLAASADTKKGDTWSISDLKVTAPQ